jgi:hypothetical protein
MTFSYLQDSFFSSIQVPDKGRQDRLMYSYSGKLGGSAAMFEEDFVLVLTNAREFMKFSTYNSTI